MLQPASRALDRHIIVWMVRPSRTCHNWRARILPSGVRMRTGRPVAKIEMSAEVAGILEGYTQRRKTAQALALRARIVLDCAAGLSNKAVAARERVTPQTVGKWRRRFAERGLMGCSTSRGQECPAKLTMPRPKASLYRHWRGDRREPRIGARAAWHGTLASRLRASRGSGVPSGCSRTAWRLSSCPLTRCLSPRCATLSGSTSIRPTML
jgi:hypothetical protein